MFFEALGIEWEYEPEGYDLGSYGYYLPDFYLPNFSGGIFAEVKPKSLTKKEMSKAVGLYEASKTPVLLAIGTPGFEIYQLICEPNEEGDVEPEDVCFNRKYTPKYGGEEHGRLYWFPGSTDECDCEEAIYAARGARFEHGEQPA